MLRESRMQRLSETWGNRRGILFPLGSQAVVIDGYSYSDSWANLEGTAARSATCLPVGAGMGKHQRGGGGPCFVLVG
jgi:hypothetical protein